MKLVLFLIIIVVHQVIGFDVIREAFELIDENVNPCDNFYRHACPLYKSGIFMLNSAYEDLMYSIEAKFVDAEWNNLDVEKTFKRTLYKELPSIDEFIANVYLSLCQDIDATHSQKEAFLLWVQNTKLDHGGEPCIFDKCLKPLAHDKNCTRAAANLRNKMDFETFDIFQKKWRNNFDYAKTNLYGVNAILEADVRGGIVRIRNLVQKYVDKLSDWIKETPWAINNKADNMILDVVNQLYVHDNLGISLRKNLDYVFTIEQNYLKCLRDTKQSTELEIFCMLMACSGHYPEREDIDFFNPFNAFNDHPHLHFSYILLDMAEKIKNDAAFLGSVGYIAGHEVSHTLIEDANNLQLLPYFSNETVQCIQGQYQKTCDSYKEISCGAVDNQIDENGSDMLGMRLAYSVFNDEYDGSYEEDKIQLPDRTVNLQQLFFYSTAFVSCSGLKGNQDVRDTHSPWHIRVNAMMQIPEFRQAFQCDAESEMVKSFGEECVIVGKNAPQTRK
ncbi:hypothetical protein CAEBREN_15055 [Caenorhabditis brenneri]|uniref:Peptidase M13 C-terminal domain-containing protein n=1 Tax=Caenorhabditis brenneri TaxID=135651 RepID=G0N595_CAEBE|nr:hypothetical protein CAEBREN_15055 [Caenorhabditis brenneri]